MNGAPGGLSRTWRGAMVAVAVGLAAFALLSLFPHALIHPSVCEEVAVAAGLRPPVSPFPGIYRGIASFLLHVFPLDAGLSVLRLLGRLGIAAAAAWTYLAFRGLLPAAFRLKAHMGRIGARVGNVAAAAAALLFVCADPVWRAGQFFSPTTVFLVLAVASAALFLRFVGTGGIRSLYCCFALLGMMSAETALGILFALLGVAGLLAAVRHAGNPDVPLVSPLVDRLVREIVFRRVATVWAASFVATAAHGMALFVLAGGMEAAGLDGVLGLAFAYFKGALDGVRAAAAWPGLFFGFFISVVPLLFSVLLLPRARDDDSFLPYRVGAVYLGVCAVALSQLAGWRVLQFWNWSGSRPMFASDALLAFFLILDIVAVAFSLGAFGIDAYCRNYRQIALRRFPESVQLAASTQVVESLGRSRRFRRRMFLSLAALVPLCALPGRRQAPEREAERVVAGYVDEVLRETEGCDAIFTDGSLDLYLELEARRRGRTLNCLSMLAPDTVRERTVRLRAAENAEDRAILANDAVSALRTWLAARPERMGRTAVQLGFELWKRDGRPLPPFSGVAARPGGVAEGERARALEACRALGERACALAPELKRTDPALVRLFSFAGWRLARMAQMRGQAADAAGLRGEAIREAAFADALDDANPSVAELRRSQVWQTRQGSGVLTPREGLVIGLARADFALAGRYAAPILAADPDDPRANFAMGMMYYTGGHYARAEKHLLRCLVRRPDDAAVLNNLALAQLNAGRLAEAETNAARAMARLPDSPEIRKTMRRIEEKKRKASLR